MAVTRTYLQGVGDSTNATSYTFSSQNLGAADADRQIVVAIAGRALGTPTLSSVTVGGVSATINKTQYTDSGGARSTAAIAIADVPTGTTGDVVLTYSAEMLRVGQALYSVTGANHTAYDTGGSSADNPSASLDIPADGYGFGTAFILGSATWTNLTEDYDEIDIEGYDITGASSNSSGDLTRTCTPDPGQANVMAGVFVSYEEAGALSATLKTWDTVLEANIKTANTVS